MKHLSIFMLLFVCFSCIRHNAGIIAQYKIHIENKTTDPLTISFFKHNKEIYTLNILAQSSLSYDYIVDDEGSYYQHEGTSFDRLGYVIVRFPNNKGYLCENHIQDGERCFQNPSRNLLYFDTYKRLKNDYIFFITQEDYENAHELPE